MFFQKQSNNDFMVIQYSLYSEKSHMAAVSLKKLLNFGKGVCMKFTCGCWLRDLETCLAGAAFFLLIAEVAFGCPPTAEDLLLLSEWTSIFLLNY